VKLKVAAAVEDAYVPSEALEMMTTHPVATLEVSTFPDIEQPEVEVLRETDPPPVPPAELNVIDEPTVVVDGEPETLRAACGFRFVALKRKLTVADRTPA
jgi:hypothetical protein